MPARAVARKERTEVDCWAEVSTSEYQIQISNSNSFMISTTSFVSSFLVLICSRQPLLCCVCRALCKPPPPGPKVSSLSAFAGVSSASLRLYHDNRIFLLPASVPPLRLIFSILSWQPPFSTLLSASSPRSAFLVSHRSLILGIIIRGRASRCSLPHSLPVSLPRAASTFRQQLYSFYAF